MKEAVMTAAVVALATSLRKEGLSWSGVSKYLGISIHKLRYRLDPDYVDERRSDWIKRDKKFRTDNAITQYAMPPAPLLNKDKLLDRLRAVGHEYAK